MLSDREDWFISPHLNKHLYWSESSLVINRSVTRSCVYQVHPTQMGIQDAHSNKAKKSVPPLDTGDKRTTIQLKAGPLAISPSAPPCRMGCETLGRTLGCSQISKDKQFPLQSALFSHFLPTCIPFSLHPQGSLILVNHVQPSPNETGRNLRSQRKTCEVTHHSDST